MNTSQCFLCLSENVSTVNPRVDYKRYLCHTCFPYMITRTAEAVIGNNLKAKTKLSALLMERDLRGLPPVIIHSGDEDYFKNDLGTTCVGYLRLLKDFPDNLEDKLKRGFLNISRVIEKNSNNNKYGKSIKLIYKAPNLLFAESAEEFIYVVDILNKEEGLLEAKNTTGPSYTLTITRKGWARVAELSQKLETNKVFVAMWFDKDMECVRESIRNAVQNAIHPNRFKALFINELHYNDDITDKIIAEIRRSKFVIAEFSGMRGGVYYEAGFARGLGKEVIYICKEDDMKSEKIHFDINHLNFITYKNFDELHQKLRDRIEATII